VSFKHVHDVLESDIPKHLKLTAVVLAEFADLDTGECWPSIEAIARRCSSDPRTAQRNIRELEKRGELKRDRKHRSGTWIYRLTLHETGGVANCRGDTSVTGGVTPAPPPGVTPMPPEPSGNRQRTINKGSRECPEDFIPSDKTVQTVLKHHPHLTATDLEGALEEMRAHPYKNPIKDWNRAFRTWINNGVRWGTIGASNGKTSNRPLTHDEIQANLRRRISEAEGESEGDAGVVATL